MQKGAQIRSSEASDLGGGSVLSCAEAANEGMWGRDRNCADSVVYDDPALVEDLNQRARDRKEWSRPG